MKLTIPSPKNIKRREAFLLTHPDYYPEGRLKAELSKIMNMRVSKKLRWELPKNSLQARMDETSKRFEIVPKKPSFIERIKNVFHKRT